MSKKKKSNKTLQIKVSKINKPTVILKLYLDDVFASELYIYLDDYDRLEESGFFTKEGLKQKFVVSSTKTFVEAP